MPALLEVCAKATSPPFLELELDELISADAVGTDTLLRLEAQGARLIALPEYLRLRVAVRGKERKP